LKSKQEEPNRDMRVVEMKKTTITRNQTMQEQTARQQQTTQIKTTRFFDNYIRKHEQEINQKKG
jgi:hypothetical protein